MPQIADVQGSNTDIKAGYLTEFFFVIFSDLQ